MKKSAKKALSVLLSLCMLASLFAVCAMTAGADNGGYASQIVSGVLHMEAWIDPGVTGTVEVDRSLYSSYTFNVTFRTYTWYGKNGYPYMGKVYTPDNQYWMWYSYGQVSTGVATTAPTVYNGAYFDNSKLTDGTTSVSYTAPAPDIGVTSGPYTFKTELIVFDSDNYAQYVTIEATRDVYLTGVCRHSNGFTSTSTDASHLKSAATCTSSAVYYKSCATCGANGTEMFTSGSPEPHSFTVQTVAADYLKSAATCLSPAVYYYKCATCPAKGTDTYTVGGSLSHSYTGDIRSDGDGRTATHSFRCVNGCGEYGGAVTHTWDGGTVTSQPTCENPGVRTFTCTAAGCGATYTEPVEASGHAYAFDSFVWADDYTAKAKLVCATDPGHVTYEDAAVTSAYTAPVCGADGYTVYTAAYGDHTESRTVTQTGTALTHDFRFGSFLWSADKTTARARLVCAHDPAHVTFADADMTSETVAPTCGADGYTVYTAAYGDNTESKTVAAAGTALTHNYQFDSFVWADDYTAKAKLVCANDPAHVIYEDAEVTSAFHAATCGQDAYTVYTAAYGGHTENKTVVAEDTALTHSFVYTANNDGTHKVTCENCDYEELNVACDYEQTPHAATCAKGSYTTYVCKDCGYTYDGEEADDKLEHSFVYTANNDGTHKVTCENCDYEELNVACDYEQTPHPATCAKGSYTTYVCKDCGYAYDGPEADDKLDHSLVYASNGDGTHNVTCANCDYEELNAACDYEQTPHDATCAKGSYTTYVCKNCGYTYDGPEADDKLPHSLVYTANNDGTHNVTCENCDHEELNAACDYEQTPHEATCTTGAYITYVCKDCGYSYDGEKGEPAGHAYGVSEWIWAADNSGASVKLVCAKDPAHELELPAEVTHTEDTATEYEGGVIVYTATATIPGTDITFTDTKTVDTLPLGHTHVYGEWVEEVEATCEGAGTLGHYTCAGCGRSFDENYNEIEDLTIPAKGHRWSEPVFAFSEDGKTATATRTCANADHPETKNASVTGEVTKPAACTVNGETTYTATVEFDGVTYTDTKTVADVPALEHSWSEPIITFSADGKTATATRTCANGDHPETKAATVTSEVTKPATCTGRGETTYTASVVFDGVTYTAAKVVSDIAANGHSWDDGAVVTEPTCTGTGKIVYTCSDCGETREETIGALGHDWGRGEVTKPATATETGVRTYTCSRCGETKTETIGKVGACPICNAPHDKNLLDRLIGLIHSIIYFFVTLDRTF